MASRLITHVETSRAGNGDVDITPIIRQALQEKKVLPKEHLTNTNYAQAKQFIESSHHYGINFIAPTRADHKWQAKEGQGFDAGSFQFDWEAQKATCPTGRESSSWTPTVDRRDNQVIKIKFSVKECKLCLVKAQCTTAPRRTISIRIQEHYQVLQAVRTRQKEATFWATW